MKNIILLTAVLLFGFTIAQASPRYDELVKLIKSGTSEEVILAYINASDSSYNLSTEEIVHLKEFGAPSKVIVAALQHKGSSVAESPSSAEPAPSTGVRPHHYILYKDYTEDPRFREQLAAQHALFRKKIDKMENAFQIDLASLAGGAFTLNYEHLFAHQFGLVLEGSLRGGQDENGNDFSEEYAELAYRWHFAKSMNSGFLGVFVKGGRYRGTELNGPDYAATLVSVGPNIGKRWVAPWGFNVVARIGYGFTWNKFDDVVPDQHTINMLNLASSWDAEVSVGYAF